VLGADLHVLGADPRGGGLRESLRSTHFDVRKLFLAQSVTLAHSGPTLDTEGRQADPASPSDSSPIRGGSDSAHDLATTIRAKVVAGRLPRERPQKVWVGPGAGKPCDGCSHPITASQREYEFDPPGWPTIRLHQACLELLQTTRMEHESAPTSPATSSQLDTWGARLAAVLRDSYPSGYCIECLATKLDLPPKEIRDAAQLLVLRPGFQIVERACYTCGHVKDRVLVFAPRTRPAP
jgi:hypothetical protein